MKCMYTILQEENSKLSCELQRAVDQSTNMCEKAIKLELKCEKLKTRLDKLKTDTQYVLYRGSDVKLSFKSMDCLV